jgi:hypothetical protein
VSSRWLHDAQCQVRQDGDSRAQVLETTTKYLLLLCALLSSNDLWMPLFSVKSSDMILLGQIKYEV